MARCSRAPLVTLPVLVVVVVLGVWRPAGAQEAFVPVTDAMLENPGSGDWLNYRRTLDGWGYSPLDQINRDNVHQLQLVWSWALAPGISEPTPLVYNGVMYIPDGGGTAVLALDAVTGELLWKYEKRFEEPPTDVGSLLVASRRRTRNIAIHGDRIYWITYDAHLLALNAATGALVWDRTIVDFRRGYRMTSGPIVVQGKIVTGLAGCDRFQNDNCFISAYDAATGQPVWRTSTIARPGEPGDWTWGDLPALMRAGGDAWIPGSYDPELNLIYWATAQAKPFTRFQRGTDGDALYTNSVLALDPDTGRLVWYRQLLPGETHDQDEVYENVLVDHSGRKSVFKVGKLGILWEVDRESGQFRAAHDSGYQTLLDVGETGEVTYRPGMIPEPGKPPELVPQSGRVQELAGDVLPPRDPGVLYPAVSTLLGHHLRGGRRRGAGGRRRHGAQSERKHAGASREPGRARGGAGDRRERQRAVAESHARPADDSHADDGRGLRGGGRLGPEPVRLRRQDRRGPVPHAPAERPPGVSHDVRGRRDPVSGSAGRDARRGRAGVAPVAAESGVAAPPRQHEWHLRFRVADRARCGTVNVWKE